MKLSVEFLGLYGAADVTARKKVEWPPHPDRVYQALVDAALPEDRPALAWIEQQTPPDVDCGSAVELQWGAEGCTFVPTNYPIKNPADALPEFRNKQARQFPMAVPEGPVSYVWQADPPPSVFESLHRTVARVTHLGRSDSLAMLALEPGSAPCRWVPQDKGNHPMRVPRPGRLQQLDRAFANEQRSPIAPQVRYGHVDDRQFVAGPWEGMVVMRLSKPIAVEHVALAADALRRAVLSRLGDTAPLIAHGHAATPHMAWVGLPNLSDYGDGTLIGLAMVIPNNCDPLERAHCIAAVLQISHIMLAGVRFNLTQPTAAMSLHERTWSRPARRWVSATPVVLDRFPKGTVTAEDIVAQGCVRAGYPLPTRVTWSQTSDLAMPPAREFRLRKPGGLFAHAVLEFDQPVQGPMLVGRERYFGLGLFLPQDARTPSD
ncbi:MAG: type I-U CRISPR-associated protein Cas5/Cas6 [Rhodoferax ferrireducens]|uniref:Type I-U CRISPR-associated protein Cas5/Cas6 n=1 Tax=Rhodoferax ferrireducens TaxID=192843 RepID=A0A1W9KQA4_9BURK|nr:MAG: type I-U CRISPR-associated protein Cas5/Cas6 [Rhodoferax ferrireducens]